MMRTNEWGEGIDQETRVRYEGIKEVRGEGVERTRVYEEREDENGR